MNGVKTVAALVSGALLFFVMGFVAGKQYVGRVEISAQRVVKLGDKARINCQFGLDSGDVLTVYSEVVK